MAAAIGEEKQTSAAGASRFFDFSIFLDFSCLGIAQIRGVRPRGGGWDTFNLMSVKLSFICSHREVIAGWNPG